MRPTCSKFKPYLFLPCTTETHHFLQSLLFLLHLKLFGFVEQSFNSFHVMWPSDFIVKWIMSPPWRVRRTFFFRLQYFYVPTFLVKFSSRQFLVLIKERFSVGGYSLAPAPSPSPHPTVPARCEDKEGFPSEWPWLWSRRTFSLCPSLWGSE